MHIDWNVESRIILALGQNGDSDKQIAKSINFDTMEHSALVDSRNQSGRNSFSPREKLSVSVRNDAFVSALDNDMGQQEFDTRSEYLRSPNYLRDSSIISDRYSTSPLNTPLKSKTMKDITALSGSEAPSPQYHHERNSTIRNSSSSPSPPPPPNNFFNSRQSTPPSVLNSTGQTVSDQRKSIGITGTDSVLDRLRAIEGTLLAQTENNSSIEEKILNVSEKLLTVDSSIHPAIHELQLRFDRELLIIRREFESR